MIRVQFFASLKELTGRSSLDISGDSLDTAEDVYSAVAERYPALRGYRQVLLLAVNEEYASWETKVKAGDTIALFPPVSGGAL
jgi:molybdopterin synthase sulfur carrier subunit